MNIERRIAVRSSKEALQRYRDFEQMQNSFISYKNRVEVAIEVLKDITNEIHEIQMKNVKHKKNGYITSTVGSSVLGTALIGGLVTANPLVTVGIFTGTVLTSVGSIIVFTKRDKNRLEELDTQVTGIMLGLEQEFERCHTKVTALNSDVEGIDELRDRLREASSARQTDDQQRQSRVNLDVVTNVVQNMFNFSQGLRSRINEMPADVRDLLSNSLNQIQYFISPYGASQFANIIKNEVQRNTANTAKVTDVCCAAPGSSVDLITPPAAPIMTEVSETGGTSIYGKCGKVGKMMYTVGAVFAAYEFYHSLTQAKEFSKRLQRLRDSAELCKYEGAAKEVFSICLDLQALLTIFNNMDDEYEMIS